MREINYLVLSTLSTQGKIEYHKNKKKMLKELGYSCKIIGLNSKKGIKKLIPWPISLILESLELKYKLRKFLKKNKVKIIEFDNTAVLLQDDSIFKDYKTIISFDHPYCYQKSKFTKIIKVLEKKKLNKCDFIVSRSREAYNFMKEYYSNVLLIPHNTKKITSHIKLGKRNYVLFYSSSKNQFNLKGLDILLSFWLQYAHEDLRLKIVGAKKEDVIQFLLKKNIDFPENIDFLRKVDHKQFLKLLRESYFVINSARSEATGLSTLEALSEGKIIICTPTKGSKEFLSNNQKLLVKDFTAKSFVKKITEIEKDNKEIKIDLREFSYKKSLKKLNKMLESLK